MLLHSQNLMFETLVINIKYKLKHLFINSCCLCLCWTVWSVWRGHYSGHLYNVLCVRLYIHWEIWLISVSWVMWNLRKYRRVFTHLQGPDGGMREFTSGSPRATDRRTPAINVCVCVRGKGHTGRVWSSQWPLHRWGRWDCLNSSHCSISMAVKCLEHIYGNSLTWKGDIKETVCVCACVCVGGVTLVHWLFSSLKSVTICDGVATLHSHVILVGRGSGYTIQVTFRIFPRLFLKILFCFQRNKNEVVFEGLSIDVLRRRTNLWTTWVVFGGPFSSAVSRGIDEPVSLRRFSMSRSRSEWLW